MNRTHTFTAAELSRLHAQARIAARALRQQALIDFWNSVDAIVVGAVDRAVRSAARLARRHGQGVESA